MTDLSPDARIERVTIASQNLSVGPLAFTYTPATDFRILGVYLLADASLTDEELDLTINISGGPIVLHDAITLDGNLSMVYRDDQNQIFKGGDEVRINITNVNTPAVNVSGTLEVELL